MTPEMFEAWSILIVSFAGLIGAIWLVIVAIKDHRSWKREDEERAKK